MRAYLRELDADIDDIINEVSNVRVDSARNKGLRKDILRRFLALALTDDERAALYKLPQGCRMRENAKIINPENLNCGEYVWIGEGAILDASGGLTIGAHTTVGSGVYVWSHHSVLPSILNENITGSDKIFRKSTRIGSGCFIAGPTVINPGVTIGNNAVILSMSVITADIPSHTIVGGAPAKIKGDVNEAFIEKLSQRLHG